MGDLVKLDCAGDRPLQLLVFNEEFLVSASYQLALTIHSCPLYTPPITILSIDWLSEIFRLEYLLFKLCNWIEVALDCLNFTLNYLSDNYCT